MRDWPPAPVAACTALRGSCCLALERASCLPWPLVSPFQASSFCKRPKTRPPLGGQARSPIRRANNRLRLSAGSPGHRRIPPVAVFALRDVRAGFMFAAQAVFCACLGLLFRLPRRVPLQASKRNQKTRPGIRPQPLLGWGALAASLLPAARRHGPSWTEAALAASCHSSPSATIPLGLLTGRVCRPTTWRANLTSCMPGTRSVGRIPPMAAFALRDYTAMNGAGWPFCSFLSFLAAYTAVNACGLA